MVAGTASCCSSRWMGKISLPAGSQQEATTDSKLKLSSTDTGQNSFLFLLWCLHPTSPRLPRNTLELALLLIRCLVSVAPGTNRWAVSINSSRVSAAAVLRPWRPQSLLSQTGFLSSICRAHRAAESSFVAGFLGTIIVQKITTISNYSVPREWWHESCRAESCFVYTLAVLVLTVNPHLWMWVALISYDSPHACFFPAICCIALFPFDTEIIQELH